MSPLRARPEYTWTRLPGWSRRGAALLDGRDHAEGARLLEEERDDHDLAGLQLARQLRERDALAVRTQAQQARARHRQLLQRLAGRAQDLRALGDRQLHPN